MLGPGLVFTERDLANRANEKRRRQEEKKEHASTTMKKSHPVKRGRKKAVLKGQPLVRVVPAQQQGADQGGVLVEGGGCGATSVVEFRALKLSKLATGSICLHPTREDIF